MTRLRHIQPFEDLQQQLDYQHKIKHKILKIMSQQPNIFTFREEQGNRQQQIPKVIITAKPETKNSTLENQMRQNSDSEGQSVQQHSSSNSSSEDYNFEGINMQGFTQRQVLLSLKMQQLRKLCHTLSQSNKKLLNRVIELEERQNLQQISRKLSNQSYSSSISQQDQIYNGFDEVEQLVKEYRINLEHCQLKVQQQIFQKQRKNDILNEQIQRLNAKCIVLQKKYFEIQQQNNILQLKVNHMENQVKNNAKKYNFNKISPNLSKTCDKSYKTIEYENQKDSAFYFQVHKELEALIENLVKELQRERLTKEKLKNQIKILSNQLIKCQKQIMAKNSKIYLLELNAIKKQRVSIASKDINQSGSDSLNSCDEIFKHTKTFTFIDLLNNQVTISFRQKLYIAWKILEFYDKKIGKEDFKLVMVEDFTISNFTEKNYNLIKIECGFRKSYDGRIQQESKEKLILNMAFILDTLINQVPDDSQSQCRQKHFQDSKEQVSKILENILGNKKTELAPPVKNLQDQIKQIILHLESF